MGDPDKRFLIGKSTYHPYLFEKLSTIFSDEQLAKRSWLPNFVVYSFYLISSAALSLGNFNSNQTIFIQLACLGLVIFEIELWSMTKLKVHFLSLQPRFLGAVLNSLHKLLLVGYVI